MGRENERVVQSWGGQSAVLGFLTTESRLLCFVAYDISRCHVVDPVYMSKHNSLTSFAIKKIAFGHSTLFAVSAKGQLMQMCMRTLCQDIESSGNDGNRGVWVMIHESESATSPEAVVDVDSGSRHHAFVTLGGAVYTWGSNAFGMLGHGILNQNWVRTAVKTKKCVDFFNERNMRVVAVGCGGDAWWEGAFTL